MSRSGHGRGVQKSVMLGGTGQMSGSTQGQRVRRAVGGSRRARERGVALVEFSFVAILLFALVFGIIGYAMMMSLRQSMTQATAEGARAGAVAAASPESAATVALNQALDQHDVSCAEPILYRNGSNVGTCDVRVVDCATPNAADTAALPDCVVVETAYRYRDNPLVPAFPGLGLVLPETISYSAIAEVG